MNIQVLTPIKYAAKLEKLENELFKLKKESKQPSFPTVSLKGIWKGIKITEGDIAKAQKSLFKNVK